MQWYKLSKNKCPQCHKLLNSFSKEYIGCSCGFSISVKKFSKIVDDLNNRKLVQDNSQVNNQEALNNF